jgi:transposase
MALGRRKSVQQQDLFITAVDLPRSDGHVFYAKLNQLLEEAGFDTWIEKLCAPYYSQVRGRPGIPPGVYFRMLLVGYFEGIQSQRGIAWRCADSLSIRQFLGLKLTDHSPDHSSLTVIRERLPETVHVSVFEWVLRLANEKKLLGGKTVAVDSTRVANFKGSEASKWNDPSRTCWRQAEDAAVGYVEPKRSKRGTS